MFPAMSTSLIFLLSLSSYFCDTSAQDPTTPRWGQAHAIIQETLWVYGGKTDRYNQYSYTSAPNTNDLFRLDLSQSFDLSNPPWNIQIACGDSSGCQGPLVAFHSLSAYNPSHILLFGGQPDPNSNIALLDRPDSVWVLNVQDADSPSWVNESQGWANEPSRRIFHSASSSGGKVFITGGEKADGSQIALSAHEVFDYTNPSFDSLPSTNGPPDLYGHTSLVLRNGSLVVFGGYSQSQSALLPFSTIWTTNTLADTCKWSLIRIDNTTLPSARRNFAAVVLADGRILIHGGSDAVLQTTYGDGWILDTTRNPMVWSQVDSLSPLGARRDHMAVAVGSVLMFGFGYGANGPAPATMAVYDPSSGTWPSTYMAPPPTSSPINTFASTPISQSTLALSGTNTNSHGAGTLLPTNSGGGDPRAHSSPITAIIVGVVVGTFTLVVASVIALVIIRRRRPRNDRFHMLYPSEDDNPHTSAAIPVAQSATARHRIPLFNFGIIGSPTSPRRDMLADEDTRRFSDYSHMRDASGTSSFLEKPALLVRGSWASLRSVGALLGVSSLASRRGSSNNSSFQGSRNNSVKEKDPFSDQAAFTPSHEGTASRRREGSTGSSEWSLLASQAHPDYRDPFEDYEIGRYRDGDSDAHSLRSGELYLNRTLDETPPQSVLSQPYSGSDLHTTMSNVAVCALPTVQEAASYLSSSESDAYPRSPFGTAGRSQGEVMIHLGTNTSWSLSNNSSNEYDSTIRLGQPGSPIQTKSSLIDANPSPMRRSDSWWSRFAKSAFLDRRASDASSHGGGGNYRTRSGSLSGKTSTGALVTDFRDPTPAPKLVAIEETSPESIQDPSRQGSGDSKLSGSHVDHEGIVSQGLRLKRSATTPHERVYSSIAHGKSMSSFQTTNTEALEKIGEMDIVQREVTETSTNSWRAGEDSTSPTEFGARDHEGDGSLSGRIVMPTRPPVATRRTTSNGGGGIVASRIRAFEKMEPKREGVKYGLAPHQPLFVANPDSRKTGSLDSV